MKLRRGHYNAVTRETFICWKFRWKLVQEQINVEKCVTFGIESQWNIRITLQSRRHSFEHRSGADVPGYRRRRDAATDGWSFLQETLSQVSTSAVFSRGRALKSSSSPCCCTLITFTWLEIHENQIYRIY